MASSQPYWDQYDDINSMYFSFGADYTVKTHQQGLTSVGFERKMFGSHNSSLHCQSLKPVDPAQLLHSSLHSSPEGDQTWGICLLMKQQTVKWSSSPAPARASY
ncbi:hypothetical protein AMELA_G00195960 [Ameiurus melas]|uniref:Uncharacterized protein n=1 Tax=Ameiurus melas TaxID=219545 RepID=A0A7J6A7I7_AMEME|nr:hypothetical protein AMELA_G00195960 [Ameiurus melas]